MNRKCRVCFEDLEYTSRAIYCENCLLDIKEKAEKKLMVELADKIKKMPPPIDVLPHLIKISKHIKL